MAVTSTIGSTSLSIPLLLLSSLALTPVIFTHALRLTPNSPFARKQGQGPTLPVTTCHTRGPTCTGTTLFGLPEWRDKVRAQRFEEGDDLSSAHRNQVLLLPFAASEALLPGESREIVLKDGRFLDLFQDCVDEHGSILGTALVGDDGILTEALPLCEIRDFEVRSGFRGRISVKVRLIAVGRAGALEITRMKPVMEGTCVELVDDGIASKEGAKLANDLVDDSVAMVNEIGDKGRRLYDEAYELALGTTAASTNAVHVATGDRSSRRSVEELTAASWAILACCSSDTLILHKAIATTDLIERLRLGIRALLDEKYRISGSIAGSDVQMEGDVGFQ